MNQERKNILASEIETLKKITEKLVGLNIITYWYSLQIIRLLSKSPNDLTIEEKKSVMGIVSYGFARNLLPDNTFYITMDEKFGTNYMGAFLELARNREKSN